MPPQVRFRYRTRYPFPARRAWGECRNWRAPSFRRGFTSIDPRKLSGPPTINVSRGTRLSVPEGTHLWSILLSSVLVGDLASEIAGNCRGNNMKGRPRRPFASSPHRIGPTFFRLVNGVLGLILLGFVTFCAIILSGHFLGCASYSTTQVVNPFPMRTSSSAGFV